MTNETIEKELYIAPKVEVYSLETEGILCGSANTSGDGDDWGGGLGRSWEGNFENNRF